MTHKLFLKKNLQVNFKLIIYSYFLKKIQHQNILKKKKKKTNFHSRRLFGDLPPKQAGLSILGYGLPNTQKLLRSYFLSFGCFFGFLKHEIFLFYY